MAELVPPYGKELERIDDIARAWDVPDTEYHDRVHDGLQRTVPSSFIRVLRRDRNRTHNIEHNGLDGGVGVVSERERERE